MQFLNKFFHQIKGTAMGTPMAVNFANLFMANFEEQLLADYAASHGRSPILWLRYIDDIFFIWKGSEESLKEFITFIDNYSTKKNMSSKIEFKHHYSKESVHFLDTTIFIRDNHLMTTLYSKPTAAFDYVHRSSYHVQHLLKAIPKGQFMRIRRICTLLTDYKFHAERYIQHFIKRGYKENDLRKSATEVSCLEREQLLTYTSKQKSDRVPLVLSYHHKFLDIPNILRHNYDRMMKANPNMKEVFPSPPIVSFRRAPNLTNKLVKADHSKSCSISKPAAPVKTRSDIDKLMNHSGIVRNKKTNITQKIRGGNATDKNAIYAVECIKHNLICVGQTSQQLNERMNLHRSDIVLYPEKCELTQHYHYNDCNFDVDSKISILDIVPGSPERRLLEEDRWITKLNTHAPNGMNEKLSDFGKLYYDLFPSSNP